MGTYSRGEGRVKDPAFTVPISQPLENLVCIPQPTTLDEHSQGRLQ